MEPLLVTPPELQTVLQELTHLEPLFHAAAPDAAPQHFDALVAPEFWEVGASGRRYSRAFARDALLSRPCVPTDANWRTSGFHVSEIATAIYLLTYTLHQPHRDTRRATLWRRSGGGWQATYHQGTVVQEVF